MFCAAPATQGVIKKSVIQKYSQMKADYHGRDDGHIRRSPRDLSGTPLKKKPSTLYKKRVTNARMAQIRGFTMVTEEFRKKRWEQLEHMFRIQY